MSASLQVVTGAGAGEEIPLEDGQTLRFGRDAQWSEYAFPDDPQMSPVHFSLTVEGGRLTLRDLNSRAGTTVNGIRLPMALLKDGDRIIAGQTTFLVAASSADSDADEDEEEAPVSTARLLTEMRKLTTPLYALLDAARDERILQLLGEMGADGQSLFEGEGSSQLIPVAPHLVSAPPSSPLLERLLSEGWGNSWGLYVVSPESFGALRTRLRKLLMVTDENGRNLYFRFYDPRVMRVYLPTCNAQETQEIFGPIQRIWMEDEDPKSLVEFTRTEKGPAARKWPLSARSNQPLL